MRRKRRIPLTQVQVLDRMLFVSILAGIFLLVMYLFPPANSDAYASHIRTIRIETMPSADSIICAQSEAPLRKREGLRLFPYFLDVNWYIYYGHLILKGETFNGSREEADSILKRDIIKSYWYIKRVEHKRLKKNIKSVFTSGHLKY